MCIRDSITWAGLGWALEQRLSSHSKDYVVSQFLLLLVAVVENELPDMGACKQTLGQAGYLRAQHLQRPGGRTRPGLLKEQGGGGPL